jgi:MFS transporter, PHS family, inorganic phosphate transporter
MSDASQLSKARRLVKTIGFISMAGFGFMVDGYANLTIGLVTPILGIIYYPEDKNTITPSNTLSAVKGMASVGILLGQLMFGISGDAIGRKKVYGKELMITLFGLLMTIVAPPSIGASSVMAWICVFRLVTGIGIGGDYPMSSTLSAENTLSLTRGMLISSVFVMLGFGSLVASVVFLILVRAFEHSVEVNPKHFEWIWRLLLGVVIVPGLFTLYARLTMKETKPFMNYVVHVDDSDDSDGGVEAAKKFTLKSRGFEHFRELREYFSKWKNLKVLIGTSCTWFLFDIAFYGISLNQSAILSSIGYGTGPTLYIQQKNIAVGNIIVTLMGFLPGYIVPVFLFDRIGRKNVLWIGLIVTALLYIIWAAAYNKISTGGRVALFALSQFFLNFASQGTFILPVEVFPTRVRASAHGISAASGKAGAVLTSFAFGIVDQHWGLRGTLGLFAGCLTVASFFVFLIPEPMRWSLEDIERLGLDESDDEVEQVVVHTVDKS